jgi:two-component system phosphate regulon sensor histidine kinase PhoR
LVIAWQQTLSKQLTPLLKKLSLLPELLGSLPLKFFRQIAIMQIVVSTFVILTTSWMARYYLKTYITTQAEEQLKESLTLIKQSIHTQKLAPLTWCKSLKLSWKTRYTLINSQGIILCDNYLDPKHQSNQTSAPEVNQALRLGYGYNLRLNKVDNQEWIHGAIAINSMEQGLDQRYIVRQTVSLNELSRALKELDKSIILFLIPLIILTSLISLWGALQVSFPLSSILKKVDKMKRVTREDKNTYINNSDEWSVVEETLDKAQEGLEGYFDELYNENEKISTVMESITDSILAIGLGENILFANNHFKKNFLPKEIKSQEVSKFKVWEINRNLELQSLFNDCLLKRESVMRTNMSLPVKGGKRNNYFDIKVTPLIDQKDNIFGAVGVFHDVTERRLAEQMREDFVANVSHEVRTPLTAIKGYAQVIKSTPVEKLPSVEPFLDKIEENADRLTHLFNDILQLSVIESQQITHKETIETKSLTERVISTLKHNYKDKNIHIESEYFEHKIWANTPLIEQVLTNLIENAYKYIPSDGHIIVSWKSIDEGRWSVLQVADDGPGIAKQHHSRLFERFYRVDSGRSRDAGGTGLGLAIVKHIVSRHNGKISVESPKDRGTIFTVKLPSHYDTRTITS